MNFYEEKKLYFQEIYWEKAKGDILAVNGLQNGTQDLETKGEVLLREITRGGKILDLWCGNGLLLKILIKKSPYTFIPFWVDFLEESIFQAQKKIHPEFQNNFFIENVVFWETQQSFDYIILDPETARDRDIETLYIKYKKILSAHGKMIWFITPDSIQRLQEREKTLPFLNKIWTKKFYRNMQYYLS